MNMLAGLPHRLLGVLRARSIKTKSFAALAVMLSCFAILGANSYLTMRTTSEQLAVVRTSTLPKQAVVMDITNDIIATHMKVFRFVTLDSNGVSTALLNSLYSEILSELDGETIRLKILADRLDSSKRELELITTNWSRYVAGVKDLMDVGKTDHAMAAMMLGATDEDFEAIAAHLSAMSSQVNKRTASVVSDILVSVDMDKFWLAFGGAAGMIVSVLVAMGFVRSLVKPIQAVTQAMRQVSSGATEVEIGYHDRKDEVGQMVQAISAFRHTTQQHHETIASQHRLFDVALNNMSHGLCMFDAEKKLIVRNNRFLEIYGIQAEVAAPPCTFRDLLEALTTSGVVDQGHDQYVADLDAALAEGRSIQTPMELKDGRTVHIFNRPMFGGGWVATHEDVTERLRQQERVAYMARHDALTGLPNRLYFRERIEQALPLLRRGKSIAVFCIDLDHFKEVNDTLGHPSGDELLKLVAERLRQHVRDSDILARLGGDEFAVVKTEVQSPDEVTALATRIVEVLGEPYQIEGQEVIGGASIGVALAPGDSEDPDLLLKNADMALYRAKAEGRGTFRFFEAEMDARLQARRRLETELRKAVAQGEFEVYYQPMVDLTESQVTAFEALIRWNHPERGLVPPNEFIPMAEDIGLICPIGEWVLRQACAEATTWPRHIRVAVNLSPSQFRKTLVLTVINALAATGLQPSRLELEITESVLLQNNEMTMSILRQLHEIGVRISMDDFGTGYSSLSYLQSFPFDKIKIDRLFVADLEKRSDRAAIVRALAGLGKNLGMKTTAEGVETREQLEWLRSEGCTEVQGYFFSRPRPAKDLPVLIADVEKRLVA